MSKSTKHLPSANRVIGRDSRYEDGCGDGHAQWIRKGLTMARPSSIWMYYVELAGKNFRKVREKCVGMGTEGSWGLSGWSLKLTAHLHFPKLRMRTVITPLPQ